MSDLLGIGASGVSAYRNALAAIGENVSNAETKGYARRTVAIAEAPTAVSAGLGYRGGIDFGGANAVSVTRAWNDYQAADARSATAAAGRAEVRDRWLAAAETVIGDTDDATSVGVKLTAVFSAGATLAGNPSDGGARSAFLQSIDDAATAVRGTASGLAKVSAGIGAEARTTIGTVNAALDQLRQVNLELSRAAPATSAAAALQDQRDQLLDGIAASIDIDVSLDANGAATVMLAGDASVALTGPDARRLSIAQAGDGRLAVTASNSIGDVAVAASGGALGGLVESAAAVSDRRATLDGIATRFAASLNAWSAQGRTDAGAPGGALLSIGAGAAATLALATTDTSAIAAASSGGTANGNLLALADVRATDGAESRWAGLVNDHARLAAAAKAESASTASIRDGALASRDGTSGVDLDTEAADLLRFQQAYGGAAKIIQVARETLQTILDIR